MAFFSTVGGRLLLIPLLTLLGFVLVIFVTLSSLQNSLMHGRESKVQAVVDTAYSLLAHYHQLEQQGDLSSEQAQQQAIAAITSIVEVNDQLASATEQLATVPSMISGNMEKIATAIEYTAGQRQQLSSASHQLQLMADQMQQEMSRYQL